MLTPDPNMLSPDPITLTIEYVIGAAAGTILAWKVTKWLDKYRTKQEKKLESYLATRQFDLIFNKLQKFPLHADPLVWAAAHSDEFLIYLLDRKAVKFDPNDVLNNVIETARPAAVEILIKYGAEVNPPLYWKIHCWTTEDGWAGMDTSSNVATTPHVEEKGRLYNPLLLAVKHNRKKIVPILCEHGAQIEEKMPSPQYEFECSYQYQVENFGSDFRQQRSQGYLFETTHAGKNSIELAKFLGHKEIHNYLIARTSKKEQAREMPVPNQMELYSDMRLGAPSSKDLRANFPSGSKPTTNKGKIKH